MRVEDLEIYYERKGKGHPLILIPGYTCDCRLWDPIIQQLSSYFDVIAIDNRGCGRTKDNSQNLSAELLAKDVHALVEKLRLHKPHVIGQSMGGTVAMKYASLFPHALNKLGLMVTSVKWRQATLMGLKSHLLLREQGVNFETMLTAIIPWIYGEVFLANKNNLELIKSLVLENPYPQSLEDQKRQFAILETFDGRKDLEQISAHTFVMYGKEDIISLPEESSFLKSKLKHAYLEGFNGGHGMIAEDTEQLAKSIIRFFKD